MLKKGISLYDNADYLDDGLQNRWAYEKQPGFGLVSLAPRSIGAVKQVYLSISCIVSNGYLALNGRITLSEMWRKLLDALLNVTISIGVIWLY